MAAYIVTRRRQLPLIADLSWPSISTCTPSIRRCACIRRAAEIVRAGGLIAYPTDSCYALGWHIGDKQALERVRRIRQADRHHHFTLVCANLAEVGRFARLETWQFRLLKACLPGPYTFLLRATRETPRRLQHPRRRTIGIRVPDHPVPRLLLAELGEPLMSSTLLVAPRSAAAHRGPRDRRAHLGTRSTPSSMAATAALEPTTVIDLSVTPPVIVRKGKGDLGPIMGRAL